MYVCIYFQLKFLRNKSLLELGIFFFLLVCLQVVG